MDKLGINDHKYCLTVWSLSTKTFLCLSEKVVIFRLTRLARQFFVQLLQSVRNDGIGLEIVVLKIVTKFTRHSDAKVYFLFEVWVKKLN